MPVWGWALIAGGVWTFWTNIRSHKARMFLATCLDQNLSNALQGLAMMFVFTSAVAFCILSIVDFFI